MSDGDKILRAILEQPGDDLHRLAYADWLEERGDAMRKARFIRQQMAGMAVMVPLTVLLEAEGVLGGQPHQSLRSASTTDSRAGYGKDREVEYRRGFLCRVRCPLQAWLAHGEAICAAHPVERVELQGREPALRPNLMTGEWWWARIADGAPEPTAVPGHALATAGIPSALFSLLEGCTDDGILYVPFPSREAALDALSLAAVSLGRQRAGLPLLEAKP